MKENDNSSDILRASSPFLLAGLALATGVVLSQFAFSRGVRQQILERDGYRCTRCGGTDHLEAAHYPTHKRDSGYDTVERGITLDSRCHYIDHVRNHGKNGLSKRQNSWSINKIWERLSEEDRIWVQQQLYGG